MKVSKAINLYLDYHRLNSQKKYDPDLWVASWPNSETIFLTDDPESISPEEVLSFLTGLNDEL